MTDTPELALPLVAPSQAQKHVTVNEALIRLDALAALRLQSVTVNVPPASAPDGLCYAVPAGAVNAWAGQEGKIALGSNGGWIFLTPKRGWQALVLDQDARAIFDGLTWRMGALTLTPGGASVVTRSVEMNVDLEAGPVTFSPIAFPARAIMLGVTGRVTQTITGTLSSWNIGVTDDPQRFGSELGLGLNSWLSGPTNPSVTWSPLSLMISAAGGAFSGGRLRLVAHFNELWLPDFIE